LFLYFLSREGQFYPITTSADETKTLTFFEVWRFANSFEVLNNL